MRWLAIFAVFVVLFMAMSIRLPTLKILIGASLVIVSSMFPIQGIAGFGVLEEVWFATFTAFGIPQTFAISSGFVWHLWIISFCLFLGIYALLFHWIEELKSARK